MDRAGILADDHLITRRRSRASRSSARTTAICAAGSKGAFSLPAAAPPPPRCDAPMRVGGREGGGGGGEEEAAGGDNERSVVNNDPRRRRHCNVQHRSADRSARQSVCVRVLVQPVPSLLLPSVSSLAYPDDETTAGGRLKWPQLDKRAPEYLASIG